LNIGPINSLTSQSVGVLTLVIISCTPLLASLASLVRPLNYLLAESQLFPSCGQKAWTYWEISIRDATKMAVKELSLQKQRSQEIIT